VRLVLRLVFLVVLVAIGLTAWVGIRGWLAKDHLENAADLASRLELQIEQGNTRSAQASVTQMQGETRAAVRLTGDPVWRAYSHLPGYGPDLRAVHRVAVSGHTMATQALPSIAQVSGQVNQLRQGLGEDTPAQLLAAAKAVRTPLSTADAGVKAARAQIATVDPAQLHQPIRSGVEKFDSELGTLQSALDTLTTLDAKVLKVA
jgi:hypothetical protein